MVFLRSQDGETVLNMDNVTCIHYLDIGKAVMLKCDEEKWHNTPHALVVGSVTSEKIMAVYSTKEMAMLALDEIIRKIVNCCKPTFDYRFPTDEEMKRRFDAAKRDSGSLHCTFKRKQEDE